MMRLYDIILTISWLLLMLYNIMDLIFPDLLKGKVILRVQKEQLGRRVSHNLYWVFFSIIFNNSSLIFSSVPAGYPATVLLLHPINRIRILRF